MAGRSEITAPLVSLVVSLLLSLPAAASAAGSSSAEDVPVRGGIAALAEVIPIAPAPDRARFMAEAIRVVYSSPQTGPYTNEPIRRRIADFFSAGPGAASTDEIPVPLTASAWSQAVFHRTIARENLAGAILGDRAAALLCYGLAGMDDETLQFFADHPALLSRLAERAPASVAAFGESIRIRGGRPVVPGGEAAAAAWESVVGEKLDRPERFLQAVFENDRGRVAYLLDVLSHLDGGTLTEMLGSAAGADSLKRLAALARRGFPEWDVAAGPFVRAPADLAAFFGRLRATADIGHRAAGLGTTSFWQKVFDDSAAGDARADIAWLAEAIVGHQARERERRLDLFSFVERVFGSAGASDEIVAAARGFGSFNVLMLTLERMGISNAGVYIAAAQHAERLSGLDSTRGAVALSQFQGALALVSRMSLVGTIDARTAEALARDLFALRLEDSGYYSGAIARWIDERLKPVLPLVPATATIDDAILGAAAGPRAAESAARLEWEGQRYRVDPGGAELIRLRRARERADVVTFASALGVSDAVRALATTPPTLDLVRKAAAAFDAAATELGAAAQPGDESAIRTLRDAARTLRGLTRPDDLSDARRVAPSLLPVADALLGHALLSLAYACDLGDPDGTILIAGDPSRRHDFGYDVPGRGARVRAMWSVGAIETRKGPWHLVGSALALDAAMAPLALRRISLDRVPESPMLNLMQRDGFAATVAVMNARMLSDADRDRIADLIETGHRRVSRVGDGDETVESIAGAVGLDGWRARALSWTATHEPQRTPALLSMTELLVLGGGAPDSFSSWGTYSLRTAGCLCSRLATPGEWRFWWGLSQAGLPAVLVADLPLNVAVVLHNLHLPAVLARAVLAAAMQDFVDATNPTDGNDWLSLSRAAQAVDRTRFEDYIASAAADGPLVAESDGPGR